MTEEDIAAMREDATEHADILSGKNTIPVDQVKALLAEYGERCVEQVPLVLAEVERLQAEVQRAWASAREANDSVLAISQEMAALREIVQAVASLYDNGYGVCVVCGQNVNVAHYGYGTNEPHTPDCIVTKALAILNK